ncbi:uroporphyrinogen-III C-methyltransferase [Sphaerisporangium krabiense]|uniref:Uroporphyrin-III C-methyltransferase/precorrin-2 dehydrogenase/sirohydrochlorin ferrochelatase n=1 Tax=Sphaerisporangium krabiense TaxID=763782 RepID=A0A7W8Z766_9ACTN|nr:uroporphyrinogen-III C-methyltransferase [Sphaerisporangium krabiense]MBB5628515.1 uroporphyrin-III C-methyltransferase/precorrin-2 dehydrogenase/sirohydrochlorin ferrochelatase [Sphaerisporangium krabiense]GII67156.1 uroporphyrinogen-III C-methyltransferase [Sphaerisporangium krabiense]
MSSPYLLGLRLDGRRVLVVGGGRVAQRRVPALLDAGASVVLVSPSVTPALDDLIADGAVTWERRTYQVGDCDGAWLVHACTSDRAANAAVAAEAEAKRIWCVRADDRDASAAWTPASGRVDEISVAVTAGGDPRRAAGIRDAVVGALRDGTVDARRNRTKPVGVALVGGGPGDPGLITVRGRQLLAQADVVVADRLAPRALLDELAPDVELIDAAKIPYGRYLAQEKINELLVEHARRGRFVVRLKGGDPFVFGRGGEEMLACARAGIPVLVVPGVTSAVAVPAAEGVPVTHRGVSQEFHVISVHVAPEDPRSTVDWPGLARSPGTLVLLMAVERIAAIAHTLIREGRSPETPVMVVQDGTLPTQRALYADLSTVAERVIAAGTRPPAIVVVGDVVRVGQEIKMVRAERVP